MDTQPQKATPQQTAAHTICSTMAAPGLPLGAMVGNPLLAQQQQLVARAAGVGQPLRAVPGQAAAAAAAAAAAENAKKLAGKKRKAAEKPVSEKVSVCVVQVVMEGMFLSILCFKCASGWLSQARCGASQYACTYCSSCCSSSCSKARCCVPTADAACWTAKLC